MIIKEAIIDEEIKKVKQFLKTMGLKYDDDINYTLYIEEEGNLIATVSAANYIIKGLAIREDYRGLNIANTLISQIINYFHHQKIYYYQVFTKPEYMNIFESLNFNHIASSKHVCLLECNNYSITETLNKIKTDLNLANPDIASIVINANPTTNGHLYLIKQAAKKHHHLIVLLVEEDKSMFSFSDRLFMLKEATKHMTNVCIIPSTNYIISSLTFPSYFLKQDVDEVYEQAEIDAIIFKNYFMPILGIKKRYVGKETDLVTNKYNEKLKEILGNDLIEIERIKYDENIISASLVRKLLRYNKLKEVENYVPYSTIAFLKSNRGQEIIQKLQKGE